MLLGGVKVKKSGNMIHFHDNSDNLVMGLSAHVHKSSHSLCGKNYIDKELKIPLWKFAISLVPYHIQTQLKIGYHYRAPSAHPDLGSKSDRAQICMTSHCEMRGQQLEILGNEIKFETKKQKEWVHRKHMTIVTNCKNIFQ